jgi:hypothetical protein
VQIRWGTRRRRLERERQYIGLGVSKKVLTGRKGNDGGGGEGGVEGGGEWRVAIEVAEEGVVTGLDGEDGTGGEEVVLVGEGSGGSEVG